MTRREWSTPGPFTGERAPISPHEMIVLFERAQALASRVAELEAALRDAMIFYGRGPSFDELARFATVEAEARAALAQSEGGAK